MKRFIKLTIAFLLVFLTVLFLIIESSEITIKNSANFKLKPQTKYLVLGHSHPECAFNDSLINNLKNLAQTGKNPVHQTQYFKLENYKNQVQIDGRCECSHNFR